MSATPMRAPAVVRAGNGCPWRAISHRASPQHPFRIAEWLIVQQPAWGKPGEHHPSLTSFRQVRACEYADSDVGTAVNRCWIATSQGRGLLKVSRAAFYAYLSGPSRRDQEDADLAAKILAVHEESRGRYGAPRVHAELRCRGQRHGRKRVARLMRQAGLASLAAKRPKKTTIADPAAAARADRIRRDFTADASRLNSCWCGDITYVRTWGGCSWPP